MYFHWGSTLEVIWIGLQEEALSAEKTLLEKKIKANYSLAMQNLRKMKKGTSNLHKQDKRAILPTLIETWKESLFIFLRGKNIINHIYVQQFYRSCFSVAIHCTNSIAHIARVHFAERPHEIFNDKLLFLSLVSITRLLPLATRSENGNADTQSF